MHYDLTPEQLADHLERFVSELGVSIIGGCCGTTPAHLRAVVERCASLDARAARPEPEAAVTSMYSSVPHPSRHVVPRRGRAHQRQRVEEIPRGHAGRRLGHHRGHGPRPNQRGRPCPRRVRGLHRRRRRGRHERGGQPLRHPGQRSDHGRLDRGSRRRSRPHVARGPRHLELRSTSKKGTSPARASTAS